MKSGDSSSSPTVAVTGAAGSLAADIIPGLIDAGYRIVGIDYQTPKNDFGCEWIVCTVNDRDALRVAMEGCEAVIHLAGIPLEDDWSRLLQTNVDGTQAILECARLQNIERVVLASSIHAVGYAHTPSSAEKVQDDIPARPNTFYGATKAFAEVLGSMYHDRFDMNVICLRIASRFSEPQNERMLSTWLSPGDALRLMKACLTTPSPGYRIVWGVSANTRGYFARSGGEEIGFYPQDDAETYAGSIFAESVYDPSLRASKWDEDYLGGVFSSPSPPRFQAQAHEDSSSRTARLTPCPKTEGTN